MFISVYALYIAILAISTPGQSSKEDERVVDAAMQSFFKKTDWNQYWSEGDYVVLVQTWREPKRPDFQSLLAENFPGKSPSSNQAGSQGASRRFSNAPPLAPLKSLHLDSRILRGNQTYTKDGGEFWGFSPDELRVKNDKGVEGSVRVIGSLQPPAYSGDGKFAILQMSGVLWSVHTSTVNFYLRKSETKWIVLAVKPHYIV